MKQRYKTNIWLLKMNITHTTEKDFDWFDDGSILPSTITACILTVQLIRAYANT